MKSRIAGIVNDSIVDGPGIRCTIFFQGCTHNCEECHNKHTHDLNGGYVVDNIDILKKVEENPLLDGITFSGGEPLLQIESCIEIAKEVKKMGLNVVCYTGFVYEDALKIKGFDELKKYIDILIDGKYMKDLRDLSLRYRGSQNQRLIDMKKTILENKVVLMNID